MITLRSVTKQYGSGSAAVYALCNVSFTIPAKSYVAITGKSGSGKSTLLAVLGCLERPTSGSYLLQDTVVNDLSDQALSSLRARRLGFVFQAFHLLSEKTVLENVMTPMRYGSFEKTLWKDRAMMLLEQVGLAERIRQRPHQLSGGEQQRVAIARSLANAPDVLLADEPTGNLDSATRDQIMTLLEEQWLSGTTLIVVTHDSEIAAQAEHRLTLADGKIIETTLRPKPKRVL